MCDKFFCIKDVYEKNVELKEDDVRVIKEWVESQAHLPEISEHQLLLFFHSCYYDIEATKQCIENYYTMRTNIPEFFLNRNVLSEDLQLQMAVSLITPLPKETQNDYMVFYIHLMDTDSKNYVYSTQVKMLDMSIQLALLQKGPRPGFVGIFDMAGTSFSHLFRINPWVSKKFVNYVQEALPVRLKAVHLINVNRFTAQFINLLRPFMKKSLMGLLHVHRSMNSLYEHIPKEILPQECGGNVGTFKELHDAQIVNLENHVDFFLEDEKFKTDESKRAVKKTSNFLLFNGIFG